MKCAAVASERRPKVEAVRRALGGEDLAVVIDRVTGAADVRSQGGTWGWATRGLIERVDAFEAAVVAAPARFYNPDAYPPD